MVKVESEHETAIILCNGNSELYPYDGESDADYFDRVDKREREIRKEMTPDQIKRVDDLLKENGLL